MLIIEAMEMQRILISSVALKMLRFTGVIYHRAIIVLNQNHVNIASLFLVLSLHFMNYDCLVMSLLE